MAAIGTKKQYPIAPELFYVCPVDAGWKKDASGYVNINLLSGPAHDAIMKLQPRGIYGPGGSISSWSHFVASNGEGYNINPADVTTMGSPYSLANINNGIALTHFGKDMVAEQVQLGKQLGGLIWGLNVRFGSQQERDGIVSVCPVKFWVVGAEMNIIQQYKTSKEYLAAAEAIRETLKEQGILDVAPEGHGTWNDDLNPNNFPIIDAYFHLADLLRATPISKTDWKLNTQNVFDAYYKTLPAQLDTIRTNWGKQIFIEQFSWDYRLPDLNDTMLASLAVAWSYDSFIRYNVKNSGAIVGASTALKGLVFDTDFSNTGKTCKLIGNMFSGQPNFVELSGLPFGCNGWGVWDTVTKKYKALIANKESTSVILPNVTIDEKSKKCVSWNQVYDTALQNKTVTEVSGTGAAVIKPYSVTQINF